MPPMPLELPEIGDDSLLARYAFLPQSKDYIKKLLEENNITIEQLIEAPWLEDVRARGRVRLVESITHKGNLKSAEIVLFLSISVLLKTIPVLASAGKSLISQLTPV